METTNTPIVMPEKETASIFSDLRSAHFCIRTTSFDKIINWYMEKLDFRLVKRYNVNEMLLAFIAPATDNDFMIEIIGSNQEGDSFAGPYITDHGLQHFAFEVSSVDETLKKLSERGVETYRQPFNVPPIAKRCGFIADPWGNVIEFLQSI